MIYLSDLSFAANTSNKRAVFHTLLILILGVTITRFALYLFALAVQSVESSGWVSFLKGDDSV